MGTELVTFHEVTKKYKHSQSNLTINNTHHQQHTHKASSDVVKDLRLEDKDKDFSWGQQHWVTVKNGGPCEQDTDIVFST